MANTQKKTDERKYDAILRQLLQVWRDYYDEIFEVDLSTGAFHTLMGHSRNRWPVSGFAGIEVMLMAEKLVHPDDKAAFGDFFDLEGISKRILEDVYVTKLNFRIREESGDYEWVKVKNIIPTKQMGDEIKFFSCFRRIDDEAAADLKYKQDLVDALEEQRRLFGEQSELIEQIGNSIRSPLAGIISMAALAKNEASNDPMAAERFAMIETEASAMNSALKNLLSLESEPELPEFEFRDIPINAISYGRHPEVTPGRRDKDPDDPGVPDGFANISDNIRPFDGNYEDIFDFSGRRILIAEGNRLSSEVMRNMLMGLGADVVCCDNGKAAVVDFISHPAGTYDLVISDTELDELDGFSVVRCIRISGKEDGEKVPVFAVTADVDFTQINKAYRSGFNALFARPIDFMDLFYRMEKEMLQPV